MFSLSRMFPHTWVLPNILAHKRLVSTLAANSSDPPYSPFCLSLFCLSPFCRSPFDHSPVHGSSRLHGRSYHKIKWTFETKVCVFFSGRILSVNRNTGKQAIQGDRLTSVPGVLVRDEPVPGSDRPGPGVAHSDPATCDRLSVCSRGGVLSAETSS